MLKRQFALVVAVVVAALFGVLSPGAAVAEPEPAPVAADLTAAASPQCSGTEGWGKIRYQVCIRWNCDSTSCLSRGYLGVINNATSARTVNWRLYTSSDSNGDQAVLDDTGTVTLAAAEQQTIFADLPAWRSPCDWFNSEWLQVQYDSAGWSPLIRVKVFTSCV
ncbi:hypothetical protein [Lentzea sp. NPDC059081]|uniref:hypothetical protein n=1 Tax=Lentzea sp. NPDC059081 TaxID=3346719 RepID=UPI0036BBFFA6